MQLKRKREGELIEKISIIDTDSRIPLLRPVLELTVFSTTARAQATEGFLSFYRRFFERDGESLRWYKTNTMKHCRKLPASGIDQFTSILTDRRGASSCLLGIEQHSGTTSDDYAPPSFEFFSEEDLSDPEDPVQRSFLRICWPVEEASRPDEVVEFVKSALVGVPFSSGFCGYSYYWNTGNVTAQRRLAHVNREWLLRFPGLNYGDPITFLGFADLGILGVGWLTVLSPSLVDSVGGEDALRDALPEQAALLPIPDAGSVIRAGEKPELGDVNRGELLPSYRIIGSILSSLRVPDEWIAELPIEGLEDRENMDWYQRFLGDETP